ncbi:MAG: peptidoglycan DD-metalloendopeptidase family protein [Methylovirgula sp.]
MPAGQLSGTGAKRLQLRLTLDTKRKSRTLVLPPIALFFLLGLIPLAATIFLGATCYFVFHDDLLAGLTEHQIEMQYSYEDRLAQLRHEITNLTQHAKVNETELTERVGALMARQDLLESRTTFVASLAERAKALPASALLSATGAQDSSAMKRIDAAPDPTATFFAPDAALDGQNPASSNDATTQPGAQQKPQPEEFDLRLGDQPGPHAKPTPASGLTLQPGASTSYLAPGEFDYGVPLATRIDRLTLRQDHLDNEQLAVLNALQGPAQRMVNGLRAAFNVAGVESDQFAPPQTNKNAPDLGGPYVPLPSGNEDDDAFTRAATNAQDAVLAAERLHLIATYVPFGSPLLGQVEVTSPFGPRIDPFLGKPALHTGIDLREDYGAPVRATAAGVVDLAGPAGGYGNMVEIDHGNGLSTRYAHLSTIEVQQGQKVSAGMILGLIGETGRATGPHLHYETRINGEPVNPARFLRAGMTLHLVASDTTL